MMHALIMHWRVKGCSSGDMYPRADEDSTKQLDIVLPVLHRAAQS